VPAIFCHESHRSIVTGSPDTLKLFRQDYLT